MKQRLLEEVGKSARLKVLNELKRTQGLAVSEIADRLKMSYMGVKDVCTDLARRGLLDTWREPQKLGRPRLHYRLTQRAHDLFPTASNAATIELLAAAVKLYGPTAAEKLLLVFFQQRTEGYMARVKGETLVDRVGAFAKMRDEEGYMSAVHVATGGGLQIVEYHSPIHDVLRAFPFVAKLESDLFQRVLRTPVMREEVTASALFCATFHLGLVD